VAALCGCAPTQPRTTEYLDVSFRQLIAVDDMNKTFHLIVDKSSQENPKFGSDIQVRIENLSEQEVSFPVDLGIKLFIVRDNGWLEIQNNNKYYSIGPALILKRQQETGHRITTGIRPVLPPDAKDARQQEILRIVAIGELISNGEKTGIPVGAYTDMFVNP